MKIIRSFLILLIVLQSCQKPIRLTNTQFYLVEPVMNGKRYSVVQCQFLNAEVEIFAITDNLGMRADYTKGKFTVNNDQLIFPKGTFTVERTTKGYKLLDHNKIKYLLLTTDAYEEYRKIKLKQPFDKQFLTM